MSTDTDADDELFRTAVSFLTTYCHDELARLAQETDETHQPALHVDHADLYRYDPDLADRYFQQRSRVEATLSDAVAEAVTIPPSLDRGHFEGVDVRVYNLPDTHRFDVGDYLPSDVADEFRGVAGQVSRVSTPDMMATRLAFECQRCGYMTHVPQTNDDEMQEPAECAGCERQGPFRIVQGESEFRDHQRIRIKTPPERAGREGTEQLDVTLTGDLVRAVRPGERITANTALELQPKTRNGSPTGRFEMTGRVESVEHDDQDFEDIDIAQYRDQIDALAARDDTLDAIVGSIAPSIYGHDHAKEALAYQLFGGVHVNRPDGSSRRGNIHVLLVGDPGVGKSELLNYAADIAPRSLFTSGDGTTSAGLTAAAVQDNFGDGGWTIKAGALVKAHKGLAAIDELDDMAEEDRQGLLDAMSRGEITKTAAGQSVTLPARTTVLAGANPVHGRFDPHAAVHEQIDLKPTLVSRFDLVFTFHDERDRERDERIAEHMIAATEAGKAESRIDGPDVTPEVPPEVLCAYIAHARKTCEPTMTPTADQLLRERYLDIRTANAEDGPVPTTPRTLEAMQRLAEASARLRLSHDVERMDAERAADLLLRYLQDVGVDPETDQFDADVVETGTSKTQRERIQTVKAVIQEQQAEYAGGVPHDVVVDRCEAAGVDPEKVPHELQTLKDRGKIYEPAEQEYRTV